MACLFRDAAEMGKTGHNRRNPLPEGRRFVFDGLAGLQLGRGRHGSDNAAGRGPTTSTGLESFFLLHDINQDRDLFYDDDQ